jgi:hypothetical protein
MRWKSLMSLMRLPFISRRSNSANSGNWKNHYKVYNTKNYKNRYSKYLEIHSLFSIREFWVKKMSCGLDDIDLFILYLLYNDTSFKRSAGYHEDKLLNILKRKFNKKDIKKSLKKLQNGGYISKVGKSPEKYFISDFKRAVIALGSHGYNVTKGKTRAL